MLKKSPSVYHQSFALLVEMDRRLSHRGLVLSEFACDCEVSRSTAGRYLSLIVIRIGLPVTCRMCASDEIIPAIDSLNLRGRGRRVYRYDAGCEGLFTRAARSMTASNFHQRTKKRHRRGGGAAV